MFALHQRWSHPASGKLEGGTAHSAPQPLVVCPLTPFGADRGTVKQLAGIVQPEEDIERRFVLEHLW